LRFKLYPVYKDSGVEWLGESPAGWEIRRLENCAQRAGIRTDPKV
jgi:type I restriction enzyme S subunit